MFYHCPSVKFVPFFHQKLIRVRDKQKIHLIIMSVFMGQDNEGIFVPDEKSFRNWCGYDVFISMTTVKLHWDKV